MEDKHIYRGSRWQRFVDRFIALKKEFVSLYTFESKKKRPISWPLVKPLKRNAVSLKNVLPQKQTLQKEKPKTPKVKKIRPKLPRKILPSLKIHNETTKKILSLGLFLSVVGVMGAGIYFSLVSKRTHERQTIMPSPKKDITIPSQKSIDPTANWNTFKNDFYKFEFSYPNGWGLKENPLELTNPENFLTIVIASYNPNIVGVDYCSANPKDTPRCENLITNNVSIGIDWGENRAGPFSAVLSETDSPSAVSVTMFVNESAPEAKRVLSTKDQSFLRLFLSTFKIL